MLASLEHQESLLQSMQTERDRDLAVRRFKGAKGLNSGKVARGVDPSPPGRLPFASRWSAVLLVFLVGLLWSARATLADGPGFERSADELWLVDCRALTTVRSAAEHIDQRFRTWRFARGQEKWQAVPERDYLQAVQMVMPTCVWVHGDRVDCDRAFQIGREVYQQLVGEQEDLPPLRFVIWSWPTTHQLRGRPLKDARMKAARADAAGYSLGWMLNQFPPASPVSLLGFSFGARVVTGAVHVTAGGQLAGYEIPGQDDRRATGYQVVLIAAAMGNNWLEAGQKYDQAFVRIDRLLLLNNCQDWVLKRYHLLKCGNGCEALGYTGLGAPDSLADHRARISQVNAGPYIGKQHRWGPYIYSAPLMGKMRATLLGQSPAPVELPMHQLPTAAGSRPPGNEVTAVRPTDDSP